MVNTNKLKGRIREMNKTQKDCATELGIKTPTFNQKINNIRPFSLVEAQKLRDMLNLRGDQFAEYFFHDVLRSAIS